MEIAKFSIDSLSAYEYLHHRHEFGTYINLRKSGQTIPKRFSSVQFSRSIFVLFMVQGHSPFRKFENTVLELAKVA